MLDRLQATKVRLGHRIDTLHGEERQAELAQARHRLGGWEVLQQAPSSGLARVLETLEVRKHRELQRRAACSLRDADGEVAEVLYRDLSHVAKTRPRKRVHARSIVL